MPEIKAPVGGFSGTVAGVVFRDGVGSTDDEWALNYFRRHGYEIAARKPGRKAAKDA